MERRLVSALTLALLIAIPSPAQAPDPTTVLPADTPQAIRITYNEAVGLLNAGNGVAALDKFREVIRVLPNYLFGHLAYADALEQAGKMSESMAEIETAARLSPDNTRVLQQMGRAYQLSGRRDESIHTFERYLWLYPNAPDAANIKNVVEQMKSENLKRDIFADSRGKDNYLEEALAAVAERWSPSSNPIPVYIHNGTGVYGYSDYLSVLLKQAFAEWAQNCQGKVSFRFVDNPASCLIECTWVSDAKDMQSPIETGETQDFGAAGKLESSKITLLTTVLNSQPQAFKGVCLHEIGHALGLQGHSTDPGDIMYMFSKHNDARANILSERDRRTLLLLYSISGSELGRYGRTNLGTKPFFHDANAANQARIVENEGIEAINAGRYTDALRSFQEGVRLSPNTAPYNANLANAYAQVAKQELKSRDYVKFQQHMELAAKYAVLGRHPETAASAYADLARFARSLKNENDARMYEEEARKFKQQKAQ